MFKKKVKFLKSKWGTCLYLDDSLFKNGKEEKIIKILKLFSIEKDDINCSCFVDNKNNFLEKLKTLLDSPYTILFQKKDYAKIEFTLSGSKFKDLIALSVQNDLTIEAICYNSNEITLRIVINDHDGTCIIFNPQKYDVETIKRNSISIVDGKMKFKLSESEKEILHKFNKLSYPSIYKTDDTDNILFVETVDFDVCPILLKGKDISKESFNEIMMSYDKFLNKVNLENFDDYALEHYHLILEIMEIFKKYYGNKSF